MAIYHCSVKIGSRANGKSAVASASYRSAKMLHSIEENKDFNYTRKQAVIYSEIMLPSNAPKEYEDRATLWNAVEQSEKRADAQLFREFEISLPNECNEQEKLEMTRVFAQSLVDEGMCVDFSIHDVKAGQYKTKGNIATNDNSHVHIMCTMRAIGENGKFIPKRVTRFKLDERGEKIPVLDKAGKQKLRKDGRKLWEREDIRTTDWDSKEKIEEWRLRWESIANRYLSKENKIDCRTLEEQTKDLDKEMTLVKKVLELNERINENERIRVAGNDSAGRTEIAGAEKGTAGNRTSDTNNQTARELADRAIRIKQIVERREREAAEAERARKEAQLREQQLEAERRKATERARAERARNSKSHEASKGFSR